jgi:putative NADH-flavin reductase
LSDIKHEKLQVRVGDVLNYDSVLEAIRGHEAVFCTLGAGRKGRVRAEGTGNIITAMKEAGIRRFICQTTLGVGKSWDNLNFFWKRIMFGWFLKEAFEDHELQEKHIERSRLDWTIVRPGAFTNGPVTGKFRHGFPPHDRTTKLKISRGDLSLFMLQQLKNEEYMGKAVGLSY